MANKCKKKINKLALGANLGELAAGGADPYSMILNQGTNLINGIDTNALIGLLGNQSRQQAMNSMQSPEQMQQSRLQGSTEGLKKFFSGDLGGGLASFGNQVVGDISQKKALNDSGYGNYDNMFNHATTAQGIRERNKIMGMAKGGYINPTELTEFNEGGSHEANSMGGIPQGFSQDGSLNMVEQGETKWENYIFSDRLKIDKMVVNEFHLPKSFIGKTFADASKKYNKELQDRPNDIFTKNTVNLNMKNLMSANDYLRDRTSNEQFADGGELNTSTNRQAVTQEKLKDAYDKGVKGIQRSHLGTYYTTGSDVFSASQLDSIYKGFKPKMDMNQLMPPDTLMDAPIPNRDPELEDALKNFHNSTFFWDGGDKDEVAKKDVKFNLGNGPQNTIAPYNGSVSGYENYNVRDIVPQYTSQEVVNISNVPQPKQKSTTNNSNSSKSNNSPEANTLTGNEGHFYNPSAPSLGYNKNIYTRRGYMGATPEEQNAWIQSQLTPENIEMWVDPGSVTNAGIPWKQKLIQELQTKQPDVYEGLMNGTLPMDKVLELYTEGEMGPIQSLVDFPTTKLSPKGFTVPNKTVTGTPTKTPYTPDVEKPDIPDVPQYTTETPKTPGGGTPFNPWSMAPMLGGLAAFANSPEVKPIDTTLASVGYLKPQLTDEQNMRANIDAANRGNIGALANVTGGSGAAQRAGLLGAGTNYMDATGNAFMQSNAANNRAVMGADQFNIQNQAHMAQFNTQNLNRAEEYNKMMQNRRNQENFEDKRDIALQTLNAAGQYGKEQDYMNMYKNVYNYDSKTGMYVNPYTGQTSPTNPNAGTSTKGGTGTTVTKPQLNTNGTPRMSSDNAGHQLYGWGQVPNNQWNGIGQIVPDYSDVPYNGPYRPVDQKCNGGKISTRRSLK
jgi:hypothetical protein